MKMEMNQLVDKIYEEVLKRINTNNNENTAVVIGRLSSPLQNKIDNIYHCISFKEGLDANEVEAVIVGELQPSMLARLATGNGISAEEQFIISMLLTGKKVIIPNEAIEFFQYKQTSSPSLYKIYEDYLTKLQSFGVQIDPKVEEKEAESKNSRKEETVTNSFTITNKVVTEKDLQQLFLKKISNIEIPLSSILTPLANDYIRKNRLKVTRMKGE